MTPRAFNRYMVALGMGTHPKFARLTDSEFRAHVVGVLAIAAMAPVRGRLLVGSLPAEPVDVAAAAGVPEKVAASAMKKLMAVGVLLPDEANDCLRVHDWDDVNPPPKADATAAERQRRYRATGKRRPIPGATKDAVMTRDDGRCVQCGSDGDLEYHHRLAVVDGGGNDEDNLEMLCVRCHRDGHAAEVLSRRDSRNGHGDVTSPEVEGEGEVLPAAKAAVPAATPPLSDEDREQTEKTAYLCHLMSAEVRATHGIADSSREALPVKGWYDACRSMLTRDGYTVEQIEFAVRWVCRHHYWRRRVKSMTRLRSEMEQVAKEIRQQRETGANVTPIRGGRESASDLLRAINGGAA